MISEMMADQVAPSYWIPNKDVIVRNDDLFFSFSTKQKVKSNDF